MPLLLLDVGGKTFNVMPCMSNVTTNGVDITIHVSDMPDMVPHLKEIDTEDVMYLGSFSPCLGMFWIHCVPEGGDAYGFALPKLSIDWTLKEIRMPVYYFESIFANHQKPSPSLRSTPIYNGHKNSSMHVQDRDGDQVVPDVVERVGRDYVSDHVVPEPSWIPHMSGLMPSLNSNTDMRFVIELDSMMDGPFLDQDVTSPMMLAPHEAYKIRFGTGNDSYEIDFMIEMWKESTSRAYGYSFSNFFRDMMSRWGSMEDDDIYVSSHTLDDIKVSSDLVIMYITKRYHLIYPGEEFEQE
jgi:hypothetical protein